MSKTHHDTFGKSMTNGQRNFFTRLGFIFHLRNDDNFRLYIIYFVQQRAKKSKKNNRMESYSLWVYQCYSVAILSPLLDS